MLASFVLDVIKSYLEDQIANQIHYNYKQIEVHLADGTIAIIKVKDCTKNEFIKRTKTDTQNSFAGEKFENSASKLTLNDIKDLKDYIFGVINSLFKEQVSGKYIRFDNPKSLLKVEIRQKRAQQLK